MIAVNLLPVLGSLLGTDWLRSALLLTNVVYALAIWHRRRWGLYGFFGNIALAFALNIHLGTAVTLFGLTSSLIFLLLLRPLWGDLH